MGWFTDMLLSPERKKRMMKDLRMATGKTVSSFPGEYFRQVISKKIEEWEKEE